MSICTGLLRSEEFPDGKYFAQIKDTNNITWKIIIAKNENKINFKYLESGRGRLDYEGELFSLYKNDITDKVPEINLSKDMKYDIGFIPFFRDLSVTIYGTLGDLSKISYGHSTYIYEANFKYVPYKHYDVFQNQFKKDRNFNTNDFIEQNLNK